MTIETLRCLQCGTYYHDDPLCGCAEAEKLREEVERLRADQDDWQHDVNEIADAMVFAKAHNTGETAAQVIRRLRAHVSNYERVIARAEKAEEEVATLREIADAAREYREVSDVNANVYEDKAAALDAALRKAKP